MTPNLVDTFSKNLFPPSSPFFSQTTPKMEHDPTFEHEIDAYVSDDDDQRPRQALRKLTTDAMSFLSRAYPNPVEADRARLQRFHTQAVSFLDRAYAEDPATLVTEEHIPPEQLLERFHNQAMTFLDVAPGPNSSARIERDKARLEQHYQDAMSFLNRADKGSGLVEEQELEAVTVERFQLQKYAREAMSFLDKAFREDASVMVEDEDLSPDKVPQKVDEDTQIAADRAALERYDEEYGDFLSKAYDDDAAVIVEDADSETSGMEGGLFARKMAASTTSADTGYSDSVTQDDDFTDEAYTDDEFQDPEGAEGARLAVLERNLPDQAEIYSTPETSGDTGTYDGESLRHRMERYEREAGDYLEGANLSDSDEDADISGDVGHVLIDSDGARVEHDINGKVRNVREEVVTAGLGELDDEFDEQFGVDREVDEEQQLSPRHIHARDVAEGGTPPNEYETSTANFPEEVDPSLASPAMEAIRVSPPRDPRKVSPALVPLRSSSGKKVPRASPSTQRPPLSPDSDNFMVDMILENRGGQPSQWSEVQLERSFYRQLPRGSTIKLRPRVSPQLIASGHAETGTAESPGSISLSELQRVERERDAALATLEDIVNERSALAAQVSEMKHMILKRDYDEESRSDDTQDIDLAAELKDAHETMAKLTEEMEATLFVVDKRYHDTLERAHKAEERCIRLEANASRLESEFASQGMRLSQAISEEQRMHGMLARTEREFEALRRKSEKDIHRIDESYREESDRSMRRVRDLTAEVTLLQEKLNATASRSTDRNVPWTPQRRLELEISTLKRQLAENDRKLVEEQLAGEKKAEEAMRRAKAEHEGEIDKLSSQLDRVQLGVKGTNAIKLELEREKAANKRSTEQLINLEHKLADIQNELIEARRGQVAAEAEAKHVRLRYEESLKKRISQMGHSTEMVEIQTSLQGLREEAANRERTLQQQLEDFRTRAEQAEMAAASAEKDAQEAAEVAKRGMLVIESERQARKAAEAEVQRVQYEARTWEKFAQQQKEKEESEELAKASSRRGIRKSPPSGKDGKKRKDKAGGSDEHRKKTSHRPRLFG